MQPLQPGSRIGILGGGQLGRMLASAGAQLGFDIWIFEPEADCPASRTSAHHVAAAWNDKDALTAFGDACDVVTLEWENVPASAMQTLAKADTQLRPGARSLEVSQDRGTEKAFLNDIGIKTADYALIDSEDDVAPALATLGGTGVLKTRRDGYDGKGQLWLTPANTPQNAFEHLGHAPAVLEAAVAFDCEISVIVARSATGEIKTWAPPHNIHEDGILARSIVPCGLPEAVTKAARAKAVTLVEALGHVGVLALELFVMKDGALIANEFAPRVHNSGHWTPEACQTGQFEQHIRAVAGWPLGDTRRLYDAEMRNLIGEDGHVDPATLASGDVLTLYGKREVRKGRKMGHITRRLGPRTK